MPDNLLHRDLICRAGSVVKARSKAAPGSPSKKVADSKCSEDEKLKGSDEVLVLLFSLFSRAPLSIRAPCPQAGDTPQHR